MVSAASSNSMPRAARIRRFCRILGWAALAAGFGLPALTAAHWLSGSAESIAMGAGVPLQSLGSFELPQRLLALLASTPSLLVLFWAMWRIRACLAEFAAGRFFTTSAINGLRDFAIGMAATALLSPVVNLLENLVLTWNAPEGQRQLVIALSSDMVLALVFSGTIAVVCWVMGEAAALAEENAQFV